MVTYNGTNFDNNFTGTAGADVFNIGAGSDQAWGGLGNDVFHVAGIGYTILDTGAGTNTVTVALGSLGGNMFLRGTDTVTVNLAVDHGWYYKGYDGMQVIRDGAGGSGFYLGGGNDRAWGNAGKDVMAGEAGNDILYGGTDNDIVDGGIGNDYVHGDAGSDQLWGGIGNDTMTGGTGNDTMRGGAGSDSLSGGDGIDWLNGGGGADVLTGGAGADTFVFHNGARGADFQGGGAAGGDILYLAHFDANPSLAGDQAFVLGSTAIGGVMVTNNGALTTVSIYNDADAAADATFTLNGVHVLIAEDFVL